MRARKHRPDIRDGFLVTRKLKTCGLTDQNKTSIVNQIDRLKGVGSVSIVSEKSLLVVSYDASQIGMQDLESIVSNNGCRLADDWWSRLKQNWYRCTGQNMRDNAAHVPSCCNKPPRTR